MPQLLKERLLEVLKAVAPLAGVVCVLQAVLVHASAALFLSFLAGTVLAIVGMLLLFTGIEMGIVPMGRYIGAELPVKGAYWLILTIAFGLGFATTAAEPDVLVLAGQVESVSRGEIWGRLLVYVIAIGVGIFVALALLRIVYGFSIAWLLIAAYGAMLLLSFFAPPEFVPLAYDAGSVTTGVLTAPVILALALGFSSVLANRSAASDGFGLLGFASVGPIIVLLILGIVTGTPTQGTSTGMGSGELIRPITDAPILVDLGRTAWSVLLSVLPLVFIFILFQSLFLKLPQKEVSRVLTGTAIASAGLFVFLIGVGIGFLPFGRAIGEALAGLNQIWMLVAFGIVLGFVTTWGEPAVRILAEQVEDASSGSIPRNMVLLATCIGVALSVGLGLFRITHEIPLLRLLVPGYGLVLALIWLSDREFVSIAVDAGGVATGPLANTFLLALAFGASAAVGRQNPLVHGLGLVSLIALAPVISVMALGLLVRLRERRKGVRTNATESLSNREHRA